MEKLLFIENPFLQNNQYRNYNLFILLIEINGRIQLYSSTFTVHKE